MQPVLFVLGTRPEAIKIAPVYYAARNAGFAPIVCSTQQHDYLLTQMLDLFSIVPDYRLGIMKANQDLSYVAQQVIKQVSRVITITAPAVVIVQGDTTTAFAGGLAAFYQKIPVCHVEAGLRTFNRYNPFPEEFNRRSITLFADLHCAPTQQAKKNLLKERIMAKHIKVTGNTVVDSLRFILNQIESGKLFPSPWVANEIKAQRLKGNQLVLFTMHRRETITRNLVEIFKTIASCVDAQDNIVLIYPHHPHPAVLQAIEKSRIQYNKKIIIWPSLNYIDLVHVLSCVEWVATDSGGICEEAISLSKRVLILRDFTERVEALETGMAVLAGLKAHKIQKIFQEFCLLSHKDKFSCSIYGNGRAGHAIVKALKNRYARYQYERIAIQKENSE